jgi:G8 domain
MVKLSTRAFGVLCLILTTWTPAFAQLPESIPDFSQDASRPGVVSVQSGSWSSASTWQGGQVPTANSVVRIAAAHTVTVDDTTPVAYTVAVDGKLSFNPSVNTRLKVTNLEVMAGPTGMGTPGVVEVGTTTAPVAASVTAEIVISNTALGGGVADVDQFGTGIVVFGNLKMHGSVKTPTFVRLATEPKAGNTTLALAEAVSGWNVGDRLVLPDTRHLEWNETPAGSWINSSNQWEERAVSAISTDRKTITLNAALTFNHNGARDLNNVLEFLPHVGNLTRNVIVRSESAGGTRGHMLSLHMADVDIRYAAFKDMGRTTYLPLDNASNHIGRYPIHMHHLGGPTATPANGFQFTLIGNAVDGGSAETKFKWGITVHGSHYGTISDNVVYNYNGAAIATEDGSESFNIFDHNFALRGIGEPSDSVAEARLAMGTEGVGFWFRGPNNFVRNNVAANFQNPTTEAAYGFVYQQRFLGNISVPNVKGAMAASEFTTRNGNNMPILQFDNNEAYGAMQGGLTIWWVNSQDPDPYPSTQESLIKNFKTWHTYNKAVYMYPSQSVTFDGLKIRGAYSENAHCCGGGVFFADYSSKGIVIRNSDIQGMNTGIIAVEAGFGPEANLLVQNSYLRNFGNLDVPTNGSVNGCWMQNKLVVVNNTRFDAAPGQGADHISMVRDVASAPECLTKLDELRVYAYNGVASDNFQVYHSNAAVLPRPPSSCTPTTRAGISGLLCPIAPLNNTTNPPAAPTSLKIIK